MEHIEVRAGERVLIARRRFNSIPSVIEFTAEPLDPHNRVAGTVERVGSRWVLGRTTEQYPLETVNRVHKGYWDTFFDIYVTPAIDVLLELPRFSMRRGRLIAVALLVVAIAAVVVSFMR